MSKNRLSKKKNASLKKRIVVVVVCMGALFALITFIKMLEINALKQKLLANKNPVMTVSSWQVATSPLQAQKTAVASLRAIFGVNVTTQLAGMIEEIYFKPGSSVTKGDILVQLNADPEIATLHSLQAKAKLAQITYTRDKKQLAVGAVSQETVDTDRENLQSELAEVASQQATVDKKTIRAPFSGRVGICVVNPGQYINPGDTVTQLETIDPIYADFYVPQQFLKQFQVGQQVSLKTDAYPERIFKGAVTTINPAVDTNTRNVEIEATLPNRDMLLQAGMFGTVTADVGTIQPALMIPQTAVSYNPYGAIVYMLKKTTQSKEGKPIFMAEQKFVRTGTVRGDQVAIVDGIKAGDIIVSSGQMKLKNGSLVFVNNKVQFSNNPDPHVSATG
ncbi:MAG: efflux transporter periplasmic adaptor subunit [Gammaproteobacteria bacterium RIFCSPHIGHO2_12_FULL_45_9]|nr:MAG: efflux transporter periplasmic adaptor subunit [Gammaproteobacteria bacterium RIFCSPHIGHO2_12_FULL_45_9]